MRVASDSRATFVSLKQLALELNMDRSHMRKYVLALGIQPHKRRTADSHHQLTLAVDTAEADQIRQDRSKKGFVSSETVVCDELGFFYVVQLVPELDPTRVKLGFAADLKARLAQHRTAAPTAKIIRSWRCKRSWEKTVIDCLAAVRCSLIANEVYKCHDTESLVKKADELFAVLPSPGVKPTSGPHQNNSRDSME